MINLYGEFISKFKHEVFGMNNKDFYIYYGNYCRLSPKDRLKCNSFKDINRLIY
jgi:hypothetical protein